MLITDYFHHSLIMLKRMMCWSTKDILYHRMNTLNTEYRAEYKRELVDNFRRWSAADYLAFELFNRTLWDRISQWGHDDFMAELRQYEETRRSVGAFCKRIKSSPNLTKEFTVPATSWDSGFTVSRRDCSLLAHHMRDTVKNQYDKIPQHVRQPRSATVPGC